jgi:hypothetical protein
MCPRPGFSEVGHRLVSNPLISNRDYNRDSICALIVDASALSQNQPVLSSDD